MNKKRTGLIRYVLSVSYLKVFKLLQWLHTQIRKILSAWAAKASDTLSERSKTTYHRPEAKEISCALHTLFIRNNGDVYPCCFVWHKPEMKIGHITDRDILLSIKSFFHECSCDYFKLRKAKPDEQIDMDRFNLELSLICQGKCAVCSTGVPWSPQRPYAYYDAVEKLIEQLQPKRINVQGGEVLIQEDSIVWVEKIKKKYPKTYFTIVTNGNVGLTMIEKVEQLFSAVDVSFMAFQPETYERIMGMDVSKTLQFAQELAHRKKTCLSVRYVATPISIHELCLFLQWAINIRPSFIIANDCYIPQYINVRTSDNFWERIFLRSKEKVKSVLMLNKEAIINNQISIELSEHVLHILSLDVEWEKFLNEHDFRGFVREHFC
jgi:MoaA/NifB/PqqE/SkfB family radical SAM enzyme